MSYLKHLSPSSIELGLVYSARPGTKDFNVFPHAYPLIKP